MKILWMGSLPTYQYSEGRELTDQEKPFAIACEEMGFAAASRDHTMLLCDDHPSSSDHYLMKGALRCAAGSPGKVVRVHVNRREGTEPIFINYSKAIDIKYMFHPDFDHVWHGTLIPNLAALEASDVLVAVGGRLTVKLMGTIAAEREKPVLAVPSFGGTSVEIFEMLKYKYKDKLRDRFSDLSLLKAPWHEGFADRVIGLAEDLAQDRHKVNPHSYFLSYVWECSEFADHVEVLLRRFRRTVNRDENLFRAGVDLSDVVKSLINESDTFIGLWNRRYLESNWCPQELEYALNRKSKNLNPKRVVLLELDDTEPPIRFTNKLRLTGRDRIQRELSLRKLIEEETTNCDRA